METKPDHEDTSRLYQEAIATFEALLAEAKASADPEPTAMTLATVGEGGRVSARIVLLKGVDARGFRFFTNYESRKARELGENPKAALVFYWPEQERQVCVAGTAERLPRAESEVYFRSRPKGSRLAAWASNQSTPVVNRAELEQRWAELKRQYPGEEVPMPPHWGGFVISPERVEFWQGGAHRLHDRFLYCRSGDGAWAIEQLQP